MKKWVLFPGFIIVSLFAFAQDGVSWSIQHNKKKIFSASEENVHKNVISIKRADLKSTYNFIVSYSEMKTTPHRNTWIRTIGIYTEADKELYRKDTGTVKLPDTQLKKMLLENNNTIKIYTWALPKDPKEAARVRIRRVHLCTIELK
jgi:cytoskeletal protein RodZ